MNEKKFQVSVYINRRGGGVLQMSTLVYTEGGGGQKSQKSYLRSLCMDSKLAFQELVSKGELDIICKYVIDASNFQYKFIHRLLKNSVVSNANILSIKRVRAAVFEYFRARTSPSIRYLNIEQDKH